MQLFRIILAASGLAFFAYLISQQDTSSLIDAILSLGWGLIYLCLLHCMPLTLNALSWQSLLHGTEKPDFLNLLRIRWIGQSVNTLLPVAQVGGDLLRANLLKRHCPKNNIAGASVVVDFTLGILSQLVFTFLGVIMLIQNMNLFSSQVLIAGGIITALILFFLYLQQRGLFQKSTFIFAPLIPKELKRKLADSAYDMDSAIKKLYRQRAPVVYSFTAKLCAWLIGTLETWLVLHLLGQPVSISDALILESLGYAARSFGFLIPAAIGIQEGAFILFGGMLGLSPITALTLSLAKRARELALGVPGLITWTYIETKN